MVPNVGDCNFQFLPTGVDPMDPILDPTECRFINILLMISFSHNQILWLKLSQQQNLPQNGLAKD